jgi:PleD family two-component response regulator
MSETQQYPTIILAGADPAWMFDMQQHLRAIVGWDYDMLLTFSAKQAMRYVTQRQVRLLITEATFLRRAEGSGTELAERAREHSADIQVLLIHDGVAPASPHIDHVLQRRASAEQTYSTLLSILAPDAPGQAAGLSSSS